MTSYALPSIESETLLDTSRAIYLDNHHHLEAWIILLLKMGAIRGKDGSLKVSPSKIIPLYSYELVHRRLGLKS